MKLKELREYISDLDDNLGIINGETGYPLDSVTITYDGEKLVIY